MESPLDSQLLIQLEFLIVQDVIDNQDIVKLAEERLKVILNHHIFNK
jgi:hypothetical protein